MVLTYHNIDRQEGFNTVSYDAFRIQMDFLKQHYTLVNVDQYINAVLNNGRNTDTAVLVTFDDAYQSFERFVMPLLERQNIPAALFVCTGYIGKTNEWDKPAQQIPILNNHQLKSLALSPLVTIGAHSVTHASLAGLADDQLKKQIDISKKQLEDLIEQEVKYFAYPYGQYYLNINKRVLEITKRAGYVAAFSSNFKSCNTIKDLFSLNRVDITGKDSITTFQAKLKHYNYYSFKQQLKNAYSYLKQSPF